MNDIFELFAENFSKDDILLNEPMKNHTSFKIGGPADLIFLPRNKSDIVNAIRLCRENDIKYYIIGNGSNLLVSDDGFRGVVIKINKTLANLSVTENLIEADAGVLLSYVSRVAAKNDLTGLEFAAGIPGTIGGAVCMNAGAHGGELKDVLVSAELIDPLGNIVEFSNEQLKFSYRSSIINDDYVVLSAKLKLNKGEHSVIESQMKKLIAERRDKQPLNFPNAGSTFKRPEKSFAGKLIMDCGLSGYSIGGAQVSQKHCGFIINKGNATAKDVMQLIRFVQLKVKEEFDVELEVEIKLLGEF